MEWRQRLDAKEADEQRRAASTVDDAGGSSPLRLAAAATSVAAAADASRLAYAKMKKQRQMQASGGTGRDTGSELQRQLDDAQRRSMLFNFVGAAAMRR